MSRIAICDRRPHARKFQGRRQRTLRKVAVAIKVWLQENLAEV